jgi:hypothetical protein
MINDINFLNTQGINLNCSSNENELLDGVSASFENSFFEPNVTVSSNFNFNSDYNADYIPQFNSDTPNVEENPIVKEVFNSIMSDHSIDLSQDPIVIDTLKALLYL